MAVNDHLKWIDFKDFTKGLHTAQSAYLMPPDAFQTMEDCYPQKDGGLRAFFKPDTTTIPTTGIVDATNERIIWVQPLVTAPGLAYLMLTKHITTGQQRGYTKAVGAGSWTNSHTFTSIGSYANGAISCVITYYSSTGGTTWVVGTTHNKSDGSEDGWWSVTAAGVWTRINSQFLLNAQVVQYQGRLIGNALNTIYWTDPGSVVAPDADNFLTIQSGNNDVRDIIVNMIPYSPTSLLVCTAGSGWWVVDGDITDPIVREMGKDHFAWVYHRMVVTQDGVVFLEPENGVFMTQNMAASFVQMDEQLVPFTYDTSMGFGYQNGFIFAPAGRCYDTDTQAWFTLSDAATSYCGFEQQAPFINGAPNIRSVIVPQFKASGAILSYPLNERNAARAESYTVKTAPLQKGDGRQAVVREVEVAVKSFHANSTVAVTCNGTTRTSAAIPVGTNVIRFPFKERGEYLDVQVVPASNSAGTEAPMIEEFRVGVRDDGHTVRFL